MRDPVPKEVETLDTILHIGSDLLRVIGRWVLSETRGKGGHPQRSQVLRAAQVPPEPESEFGDYLAVQLGPTSPGCASASIVNVSSGPGRLSALKEMPLPVPRILPRSGGAVSDERIVHRVSE